VQEFRRFNSDMYTCIMGPLSPLKGTASPSNDGAGRLDCDSRRAFGPTKTIRGIFWTQLNRLERLAALSAIRERSF